MTNEMNQNTPAELVDVAGLTYPEGYCDTILKGVRFGKATIANLTPEAFTIRLGIGDVIIPQSGAVAKMDLYPWGYNDTIEGVPVSSRLSKADTKWLPDSRSGVFFVVSEKVGMAMNWRADLLGIGGEEDGPIMIRGRLVAITCLVRFYREPK